MSKALTSRTQAIRRNVSHLDTHIREFSKSCENICDALDTLENTTLLKKVFLQMIDSLKELSEHAQKYEEKIFWELDELMIITKIDNHIQVHLRRIDELVVNIQKVFSTSHLGQAVGFALIEQEIARLHRSRKKSAEIYYTIKAHYTDQDGQITDFLESTSVQSKHWKMLHKALNQNRNS